MRTHSSLFGCSGRCLAKVASSFGLERFLNTGRMFRDWVYGLSRFHLLLRRCPDSLCMRLFAGAPGFTTVALFARFCVLPYLSISLRALSSYCCEERATANGPEGRPFLQEDVPHPPFHSAGSFFNNLDRCSNIGDSSQRREESCFSLGPGDSWYLFVGRIVSYKLLPPHCCHASAILRLCYRPWLLPHPGSIIATLQLYYCHV